MSETPRTGRLGTSRLLLIVALIVLVIAFIEAATGDRVLLPVQVWIIGAAACWVASQVV